MVAELLPWAGKLATSEHSRALREIVTIWELDPGVGAAIVQYHWLANDVGYLEASTLGLLAAIAKSDLEFVRSVTAFPWLTDDLTKDEGRAISNLNGIAAKDIDLATSIAGHRWFTDGVTEREALSLEYLNGIAALDIDLAISLTGYGWFTDDVTERETFSLEYLNGIAAINIELAKLVGGYQWFTDELTNDECWAIHHLHSIAATDIELATSIARYQWVTDGVAENECWAIDHLDSIAAIDIELARSIAGYQWVTDGVTEDERWAIRHLDGIAAIDIDLARSIAGYQWLIDGATEDERLDRVYSIADIKLATSVGLTLFSDALYEDERSALEYLYGIAALDYLYGIAGIDIELATSITSSPWFTDGVTERENLSLKYLYNIASVDSEFARYIGESPWLTGDRGRDLYFETLYSLAQIASFPNRLAQLTAQPWITDGIDDDEAAFIVVLRRIASRGGAWYKDILAAPRYTRHSTVSLALAGEVEIWVIDNTAPTNDKMLTVIGDTARIAEEILRTPFPTTDIIFFLTDQAIAVFSTNHIVLSRSGSLTLSGNLIHEIAHYYFSGFPVWLNEGGAEFVAAHVRDRMGVEDLARRKANRSANGNPRCGEAENIRHQMYLLANVYREYYRNFCEYRMGEHLLWSISDTIGEEATSSALMKLLATKPVTEEEVYRVFLEHSPPHREEELRDLYRELHGGAFAFPEPGFSDDHGDDISNASALDLGRPLTGRLDYMFDFDFFRFAVEEGLRYRMNLDHGSLGYSSVTLYDSDGLTQQPLGIGNWKSRWRVASGPQILWVAPGSGHYYFAVQNFGGETGTYTVTIAEVDDSVDDHGDSLADATPVSVGEAVQGVVDDDFDFDYFRFQAIGSREYRVDVTGGSLESLRTRLYAPDGAPSANWRLNEYRDDQSSGDRSYFEWMAPSSDWFYVAVDGARGSVGTYTLTVTERPG